MDVRIFNVGLPLGINKNCEQKLDSFRLATDRLVLINVLVTKGTIRGILPVNSEW